MVLVPVDQARLLRTTCRTPVTGDLQTSWRVLQDDKANQFSPLYTFHQSIQDDMDRVHEAVEDVLRNGSLQNVNDVIDNIKYAFQAPGSYRDSAQTNPSLTAVKDALIRVLNSLLTESVLSDEEENIKILTDTLRPLHLHVFKITEGCIEIELQINKTEFLEILIEAFHKADLQTLLIPVLTDIISKAIDEVAKFGRFKGNILDFRRLLRVALQHVFFEFSIPKIPEDKIETALRKGFISVRVKIVENCSQPKDIDWKVDLESARNVM